MHFKAPFTQTYLRCVTVVLKYFNYAPLKCLASKLLNVKVVANCMYSLDMQLSVLLGIGTVELAVKLGGTCPVSSMQLTSLHRML